MQNLLENEKIKKGRIFFSEISICFHKNKSLMIKERLLLHWVTVPSNTQVRKKKLLTRMMWTNEHFKECFNFCSLKIHFPSLICEKMNGSLNHSICNQCNYFCVAFMKQSKTTRIWNYKCETRYPHCTNVTNIKFILSYNEFLEWFKIGVHTFFLIRKKNFFHS